MKNMLKNLKIVFSYLFLILISTNTHAEGVVISDPIVRLSPPNAQMTAGYFTLENTTNKDIYLIGASSDDYKMIEIHETVIDGDKASMKSIKSLQIKANETVALKPMGIHLMLMGSKKMIKEGDSVLIKLIFSSGDEVKTNFTVKKMVMKMSHGKMNMKNMKHMNMKMHRPDFAPPTGVKSPKKMMKNKLMLSYKFGSMEMGCCKRGGKNIPNASIASLGYSMAPTKMSMDMHMFGGMYAFGSNFTMMAMIPYVEKNMEMIKISGMNQGKLHQMQSRGVGDLKILGISQFKKINFSLGLSLPTGEYDEQDHNMMGQLKVLPYGMQIGSGTTDILFGMGRQYFYEDWSLGYQFNATFRTEKNNDKWAYGDEQSLNIWASKNLNSEIGVSTGINFVNKDSIDGDSIHKLTNSPRWDGKSYNSQTINLTVGLNAKYGKNRIGFNCGVPVYEHHNAPSPDQDFKCTIGFSTMH